MTTGTVAHAQGANLLLLHVKEFKRFVKHKGISGGVNFTIFSLLCHLVEVTGLYVSLVSQT